MMKKTVILGLALAAALVGVACKSANTDYCADAKDFGYSCAAYDASLQDKPKVDGAGDASGDVDAAADVSDAATDATDASTEKPICATQDMACAGDAGNLVCDLSDGGAMCVECTKSTQCTNTSKPVCDTRVRACVECVGTGTECAWATGKPACNAVTQKCVECVDNTKCAAGKPICDTGVNQCRPCRADSECKDGPGVCVDWDGHCATATEVVTLKGGAGCVASTGVYCKASDAVGGLAGKTVLIIKGPDPVGSIDPPLNAPTPFLIVGQGGAVVSAGAGDAAGIHIAGAHKVWVRDLKVSGGTVGIVAESASELHVTRAVVTENGKGGIKTIDSSFDITNTIIAGNFAGSDAGGVGFGGVRLGDVPQGGTARFENNTVVDNKQFGVSCKASRDVSSSIIATNVGGDTIGCAGTVCCSGDLKLDSSYHLMSGSPCIDKLTSTAASPTTDIQGQPRPTAAGKLDCGADEFQ